MTNTPPNIGNVVTNPTARTIIYGVYTIVAFVAAATTVGFATLGAIPAWLVVVNAVTAFVGSGVAGLAAANVQPKVGQ